MRTGCQQLQGGVQGCPSCDTWAPPPRGSITCALTPRSASPMPTRSRVPPVMMTTRGYERIVSTRENRDYRAHTNASKILLNSFLNEAMRNMPELARGRIQSAAHSTQATRALGRRPEDVAPPRAGHPAWPGGRSGLRVCSAGPVHRGRFAVKQRARAAETAQRELDGTAAARRLSLPQSRPRLAPRSGPARPRSPPARGCRVPQAHEPAWPWATAGDQCGL